MYNFCPNGYLCFRQEKCTYLSVNVFGKLSFFFFFLIFFSPTFIYFWDRERQSMNGGRGGERGRHRTGNRLQALSVWRSTRGSNSRTARSWPGWSRTLNRLRHPGAPWQAFFVWMLTLIRVESVTLGSLNPVQTWFLGNQELPVEAQTVMYRISFEQENR